MIRCCNETDNETIKLLHGCKYEFYLGILDEWNNDHMN